MGRNSLLFCFCVVLLLINPASASDDWMGFRGDIENSGISELSADLVSILEAEYFIGNYGFYSSPVVGDLDGDDSSEIVICDEGGYVNVFRADDGRVEELWSKKITDAENSPRIFAKEQSIGVLETGDSIRATPFLADLNADGFLEIIAATRDGEILALDHSGALLWNFSVYDSFISSPVVYDIDADDSLEVMIASSTGKVYCLDNTGAERWIYDLGSPVFGSVAVGGFSLNHEPGLVVCSEEGNLTVLAGNGSKIWGYNITERVYAAPVLIDRDNDNISEILIATEEGDIIIIKNGGIDSRINTGTPIMGSPLFIDIDGDSVGEIIYATYLETEAHGAYYKNEENKVVAISQGGSVLWEVDTGGWPVFASPVAADLDRDGEMEVLIATNDGRVFMIDEGEIVWVFNKGNGAYATPAIADIDDDGDAEIIQAYFYGPEFYILDSIPKADLVISGMELSIPIPRNGENVSIFINVSNRGEVVSEETEVVLYKKRGDADFEVGRTTLAEVDAGESIIVNLSWTAEIVRGVNELMVIVDDENRVNESDERNNYILLGIPFDLKVVGQLPGGEIKPGETREFSVLVQNDGNLDLIGVTASLYMTINETDELLGERSIELLLPWTEKKVDFKIRFKEDWYNGTLKVVASVNTDVNVHELDGNNELPASKSFVRVADVPTFVKQTGKKDTEGQTPVIIIVLLLVVVVIIYKKVISKKMASRKKGNSRDKNNDNSKKDIKNSKKTSKKEVNRIENEELHLLATDEVDEKLKKLEDSL